jgi:hypothetical protein
MSNNHNAKYAFYYLLSLVALIFVSISVGLIAFGIISQTVADTLALNSYMDYNGQFRFAISALLIATPIFFVINRLINRGLQTKELDQESGIRRWLTYLILLVSSITVLGIFISIINNFLNGELTLSFVLKALTMLIISGSVFAFYLYDIRRVDVTQKDKIVKIFFFASLIIIIAVFVSAWFFMESPKESRNRRLDQIVVNNIYSLESAVNSYYDIHKVLPNSLDDLKNQSNLYFDAKAAIDPETRVAIIYNKIDSTNFEFCATFRMSSFLDNGQSRPAMMYGSGSKDHEAGYQCLKSTLWNLQKGPAGTVEAVPVQ